MGPESNRGLHSALETLTPMPNSLQVGEMPSVEPDIISSDTNATDRTNGDLAKHQHRTSIKSDSTASVPSVLVIDSKAPPPVESDIDEEDEEDLEDDVVGDGDGVTSNGASSGDRRGSVPGKSKSLGEVPSGAGKTRTRKLTAYEQVSQELANDKRTLKEITLGRRVGFYRIRTELGSGNFSQVKMAVHALTREKVAIKILDKARLDQKTQRLVAREIANMERVHHPNIVRLYEVVETLAKLYLVMEYAGGGELFAKITNEGRLKEPDAVPLFAQVISAMDHLHTLNIIHRDLKAENVFYSGPNTIKVGDFGFSTISLQGQALTTFCGSPPYAAPELFRDESYEGRPVDIWAMGIMLYFMVTGMLPFRGETVGKLKKAILEAYGRISQNAGHCNVINKALEILLICNSIVPFACALLLRYKFGVYAVPTYLSVPCVELITALLRPVAADRPSVHGIRRFQWMHGASYPDPLKPFTLNPDDIMHDNLNGEERQARKVLKELGITRDVIQKSMGKQSRSSITGTYRIVLHRIQKQTLGIQYEEFAGMNPDGTESAPSALNTAGSAPSSGKGRGRGFKISPLTNTTGGRGFPGAGGGNKVSKLCTIL